MHEGQGRLAHAAFYGSYNGTSFASMFRVMLKASIWLAVIVLVVSTASARDVGQWASVDPAQRQWFNGLMQPDNPGLSCCGEADAYWADSYEVNGDQYVAIITDTRDDAPLHRPHVENGRRITVPNTKIKWDRGNPTGHGIIFISGSHVYCYLPPGGV